MYRVQLNIRANLIPNLINLAWNLLSNMQHLHMPDRKLASKKFLVFALNRLFMGSLITEEKRTVMERVPGTELINSL